MLTASEWNANPRCICGHGPPSHPAQATLPVRSAEAGGLNVRYKCIDCACKNFTHPKTYLDAVQEIRDIERSLR